MGAAHVVGTADTKLAELDHVRSILLARGVEGVLRPAFDVTQGHRR